MSAFAAVALLAQTADASVTYWTPPGTYSTTANGNWEDANWSTNGSTLINWIPNTAAVFGAVQRFGPFTVSLSTTQQVAGIFNGLTGTAVNATISGAGAMDIGTGQQGFSTAAFGITKIQVPMFGDAQAVLQGGGQTYFDGTNSYTGGTQFGFYTAPFTGTIFINNSSSFGSGPISLYWGNSTITAEGTNGFTITNSFIVASAAINSSGVTSVPVTKLTINANPGGLTLAGPWDLGGAGTNIILNTTGMVNIDGVLSGSGGFIKMGSGNLTLTAANTYTGSTVVNGPLVLGTFGSIANSSDVTIVPTSTGSVFDVSAISSYALCNTSTLIASGSGTNTAVSATIKGASGGTIDLGSQPIFLSFTPATSTGDLLHPSLYISQGALTLNNNTITVTNSSTNALGVGTYRLIQVADGTNGTINGAPDATVSVLGAGLATNTIATLAASNGNINLVVEAAPQLSYQLTTNGQISLSATAEPDELFEVQTTTNLNPPIVWSTVFTNNADSNGLIQFTDTNAIVLPEQFYQLVFPR